MIGECGRNIFYTNHGSSGEGETRNKAEEKVRDNVNKEIGRILNSISCVKKCPDKRISYATNPDHEPRITSCRELDNNGGYRCFANSELVIQYFCSRLEEGVELDEEAQKPAKLNWSDLEGIKQEVMGGE